MNIAIRVNKRLDTVTPQLHGMMNTINDTGRRRLLTFMARRFQEMCWSTFGSGGRRFRGNTWKPYSKSYAKKVGSSTPTLLRTGALKGSIRWLAPRSNFVTVYTVNPYAAPQFFGSKKGLPPRRFMPVESSGGKSMWRLTYVAEIEMNTEISKRMRQLSGGAFPFFTPASMGRSKYSYGNPLTPSG